MNLEEIIILNEKKKFLLVIQIIIQMNNSFNLVPNKINHLKSLVKS